MATEITNPVDDESRDDEKQNYQYTSTPSPSFHELTGFQRDVLYVLKNQDDPIKGLSVKEKLEAYYEKEVNTGQLYPNLNTLVEMGLIEKGQMDASLGV